MSARTDRVISVVLSATEKTEQDVGTGTDRLWGRMADFRADGQGGVGPEGTGGGSFIKKWRESVLRRKSESKDPETETSMGCLGTE